MQTTSGAPVPIGEVDAIRGKDITDTTIADERRQFVRVNVFGGLHLETWRTKGLGSLSGRKHARALLGLLAAAPNGVERELLMEALWPASAIGSARNRLHHTVHLVRRFLSQAAWPANWIDVNANHVILHPAISSDARLLSRAVQRSEALDLHELATFFSGFSTQPVWMPELDLGAYGEEVRDRCARDYRAVLVRACEQAARLGDAPCRRVLLQCLIGIEPTNEWAWRQIMLLDLQAGRLARVRRSFEHVSRELTLGLGLRPSEQTNELACRALPGEPDIVSFDAAQGALAGSHDLHQLLDAVASGGVVNLVGMCGVGKSVLLRSLQAHLISEERQNPVLVDARHAPFLPTRVETPGALLFIDHLDESPSFLRHLKERLPALITKSGAAAIVLVSRKRVFDSDLAGGLPEGTPNTTVCIQPAVCYDKLLAREILFRWCGQTFNPECEKTAWRMVNLSGGLPVACRLIAAHLQWRTELEILECPDYLFESGSGLSVDVQPGQATMQEVLDQTMLMLSLNIGQFYPVLAFLAGPWTSFQVKGLAQTMGIPVSPAQIDGILAELQVTGLLVRNDTAGFEVMPLVRVHARRELVRRGLYEAMALAYCRSCGSDEVFESIGRAELWSLRIASLRQEFAGHAPAAFLMLAPDLAELALQKGEFADGISICRQALALAAPDLDQAPLYAVMLDLQCWVGSSGAIRELCDRLGADEELRQAVCATRNGSARLARAMRLAGYDDFEPARNMPAAEESYPADRASDQFAGLVWRLRNLASHLGSSTEGADSELDAMYRDLLKFQDNRLMVHLCALAADHTGLAYEIDAARCWLQLAELHLQRLSDGDKSELRAVQCRLAILEIMNGNTDVDIDPEFLTIEINGWRHRRLLVIAVVLSLHKTGHESQANELLGAFAQLEPAFVNAPQISQALARFSLRPVSTVPKNPDQSAHDFQAMLNTCVSKLLSPSA